MSKAIEGVAEVFPPPRFEVRSVLLPEFMKLCLRGVQSGRVRLAGQAYRAGHRAALALDPAAQIRQRAALTDEVVRHDVSTSPLDGSAEGSLPRQPGVAAGAGMADDVGLVDGRIVPNAQLLAQQLCECGRDCVEAVALVGVRAHEYGYGATTCRVEH
ncbi:MAG: hypothetical protein F4137_06475 [Acidobacteria bacterium]|nr:hypothetical protein [Acidobacteriota bacterium]MYH28496.1 hypothetical protein [Acidobacteriota bacterium]